VRDISIFEGFLELGYGARRYDKLEGLYLMATRARDGHKDGKFQLCRVRLGGKRQCILYGSTGLSCACSYSMISDTEAGRTD
jgi:hypothetical protein